MAWRDEHPNEYAWNCFRLGIGQLALAVTGKSHLYAGDEGEVECGASVFFQPDVYTTNTAEVSCVDCLVAFSRKAAKVNAQLERLRRIREPRRIAIGEAPGAVMHARIVDEHGAFWAHREVEG